MDRSLVVQHPNPLADFAEFLRLDVAQGDASPATIRTYHTQVAQFVAWCEQRGIRPAVATAEDVKEYRAGLVGHYARSTIASRLGALRRFYDMAVARGWRTDNPVHGLKAPADRTDRAEQVKWLPLNDVHRLLQAPSTQTAQGKRDRAMLALMLLHGLRVMEVAGLNLDSLDLELEAGEVRVLGKGRKWRTVLLVEPSVRYLQSWLKVREAREGETALFVSLRHPNKGARLSTRGIFKRVAGYLEALGLKRKGVACHALRHSFATLSRAAGADLDAISQVLGHASVKTTQIYASIVDKAAKNPSRFLVGAMEEMT